MEYIVPEIQLHETNLNFPYRIITVNNAARLNYWHAELELIKAAGGDMTVNVENETFFLRAGDILFIPGGEIHRIETPDTTHKVIQFDLSIFEQKSFEPAFYTELSDKLERVERHSKHWRECDKKEISAIFEKLENVDRQIPYGSTAYFLKIQLHLHQLIDILFNNIPVREAAGKPGAPSYNKKMFLKLEKVSEYVKSHYSEPITPEAVSGLINYSVNYFTKIWYRYTGMHFHTYLNSYRVNAAAALLKDSSATVTEIAFRCGFGSYKTFIRVFKSIVGTSAVEYRKKCDGGK